MLCRRSPFPILSCISSSSHSRLQRSTDASPIVVDGGLAGCSSAVMNDFAAFPHPLAVSPSDLYDRGGKVTEKRVRGRSFSRPP